MRSRVALTLIMAGSAMMFASCAAERNPTGVTTANQQVEFTTDLTPSTFEWVTSSDAAAGPPIPETMLGKDFLAKYGAHDDPITAIEPEREYAIRIPMQVRKKLQQYPLCRTSPGTLQSLPRLRHSWLRLSAYTNVYVSVYALLVHRSTQYTSTAAYRHFRSC